MPINDPPKIAVVGHVEWVEFAPVARVPIPGEIIEAHEAWEEAAGGGAVSAVQIARLAGECLLVTALGDDPLGRRAKRRLEEMGLRVEAAWRRKPQRRAFVYLDASGERTITVIGDRLEHTRMIVCHGLSWKAWTRSTSLPATSVRFVLRAPRESSWRPSAWVTPWANPASTSTSWSQVPRTEESSIDLAIWNIHRLRLFVPKEPGVG
jgi:hypothetical protein